MASSSTTSSSNGKPIAVTVLDGVVNVNGLFTIAIFVGLTMASPGQKSLNSRQSCQPTNLTAKQLVIFEVLSFSFFLFSSLVALVVKLCLELRKTELVHRLKSINNIPLLKTGMMMTAISSVLGCLFLMVSMLSVIEIKTGMLFCGSKSTIISVSFLTILVSSGLLLYIVAAIYAFINVDIKDEIVPRAS